MVLAAVWNTLSKHVRSLIDPTLEHNVKAQRPWALYVNRFYIIQLTILILVYLSDRSPLITTMPFISYTTHSDPSSLPEFNLKTSLVNDLTKLASREKGIPSMSTAEERKAWFSNKKNRQSVVFGPEVRLVVYMYSLSIKLTFVKIGRS